MKSTAFSRMGRRTQAPPISWLMKLTLDHPQLISLAAGFTDRESLPVDETRQLLRHLLRSRKAGQSALQYGTTLGDSELRRLTAKRLFEMDEEALASGAPASNRKPARPGARARGPADVYSPERAVITTGSQQLLYIVIEALCDPGDLLLVEDPTYFVFLSIAQSHGLRCRGIRLAADGIDVAHLDRTLTDLKRSGGLKRVKMLYLVSYFQNPTGATTGDRSKVEALEILKRYERHAGHPIYLLEDAAYRELRFAGEDVPSALTARGAIDRVVYAGTYSKPFATGMRVGFGLLPEALLEVVQRLKGNHDFGSSNFLQQVLRRALESCRYAAHVSAIQRRYAGKAAAMTRAMREHFPPSVRWREPRGGLYVWAQLPTAVKSGVQSKLFQGALKHDVLYVPGELCYADDPTRRKPDFEMRLSFGGASESDIRVGIARLGATLHELMDR
jgi:2-aminoadipate transaminase